MVKLLRQELFKLSRKKSPYIFIVSLLLIMITFVLTELNDPGRYDARQTFIGMYLAPSWIILFMIVVATSTISMENSFGTIKMLLARKYSRFQVVMSKYLLLILYSLMLYLIAIFSSIIIHLIFFNDFSIFDSISGEETIIEQFILHALEYFLGMWMLLSVVLLISELFSNSAIAVFVGVTGYLGTSMISSAMFSLIKKWEWLKWNPLNLINLGNQLTRPDLESYTKLSLNQLLFGNSVYLVLFLTLAVIVFEKKRI